MSPRFLRTAAATILIGLVGSACDLAPRPSPTAIPSPTALAVAPTPSLPLPSPVCPLDPGTTPISASIYVDTVAGSEFIGVNVDPPAPSSSADAGESLEPESPTDIGALVGGIEIRGRLEVETPLAGEPPPIILGAVGKLQLEGEPSPRPIVVRSDGNAMSFELPDLDGAGWLFISATWITGCRQYSGTAQARVRVLDSSVTAGCPPDGAGIQASVFALQSQEIQIGSLDVPIGIGTWQARWLRAAAADSVPKFAPWDRQMAALVVESGTSITLGESNEDLAVQSVNAAFYRLADVLAYFDPSESSDISPMQGGSREPRADGTVVIDAPTQRGDYVLELLGTWLTPCVQLGTYAVIAVEVR